MQTQLEQIIFPAKPQPHISVADMSGEQAVTIPVIHSSFHTVKECLRMMFLNKGTLGVLDTL